MNRTPATAALLYASLVATPVALADEALPGPVVPAPPQATCVFRQPWTPPASAHRSRVQSCQNPVPANRVALDDFECNLTGDAVKLRWWGVILSPQQLNRTYYVAFYDDDGQCNPNNLLYEACVLPQMQFVGFDCDNRRVYVFQTAIPPFAVTAGERYWLQISEDDQNSAHVGQDDFAWSGRQPVRLCNAIWQDANGEFGPLQDACNNQFDDLSFVIAVHAP